MKKLNLTLVIFFLCANLAIAESYWPVNGHIFSNVNTLQKGNKVTLSGRVTGGGAKNLLSVKVTLQDDNGNIYYQQVRIPNYNGRSELFKTNFYASKKAKWWRILAVE